jgi:hypothetical protein
MNDLEKFMEKWNISLKSEVKRMDGDWELRYTWRADPMNKQDDFEECKWEGFKTSKGCISNMIKTLKKKL